MRGQSPTRYFLLRHWAFSRGEGSSRGARDRRRRNRDRLVDGLRQHVSPDILRPANCV